MKYLADINEIILKSNFPLGATLTLVLGRTVS